MGSGNRGVAERNFMLDCGRKYYTPAWIRRLILELEAAGYNALNLHFSEDIGMRLESKTYPWLAGGDHTLCVYGSEKGCPEDDGKYITQDEMAEIVRFAQAHGLEVIPGLDSPAHMNYAVKKYNAHFGSNISNYFHKNGRTAIVQGSSVRKDPAQTSYSRGIDITNEEALRFVKSLYTEFGQFFLSLGCTTFDIGGDEVLGFGENIDETHYKWLNLENWRDYAIEKTGNPNAVAYDAFVLYMNDIGHMMRDMGYTGIRVWNDEAYRSGDTGWREVVTLDPTFDIQFGLATANNGANPAKLYLERGHNIYNFTSYYTYYTLGFGFISRITPDVIDAEWDAYVFDKNRPDGDPKAGDPRVKGGGFCLWSDTAGAETEDEVLEHILPYLQSVGRKLLG